MGGLYNGYQRWLLITKVSRRSSPLSPFGWPSSIATRADPLMFKYNSFMAFPVTRLRRLRQNEVLRSLVRHTRLTPEALIYPLFVCPGEGGLRSIAWRPGGFHLS